MSALTEKGVWLWDVFVKLPRREFMFRICRTTPRSGAPRFDQRTQSGKGHLQGSEAAEFLLQKFARRVDQALLSVLAERAAPLSSPRMSSATA